MANKQRLLVIGPRGLFGYEGGIEKFTDEFVPRALNVANVSVLCLFKPKRTLPEGLKVIIVPRSKLFKTDKALYLVYALLLHVLGRFDHIFIFGTNFAILVPMLRLVFWRRTKIHLRSGSVDYVQKKWGLGMQTFMRTSERFCRYADTVIAVAPNIQRHLLTLGIDSILVRNGLNCHSNKSGQRQREHNTVLAAGRITPPKNYSVLIKASHFMGPEGPLVTIIGGADLSGEQERLETLLREKPHANIHFAGAQHRDIVLEALEIKALYVNCSIYEGMSNAVLEAIQQGIPLILSDIEANRDLELSKHFYFNPEDPAELAEKIKHALLYPEDYIVSSDKFDDWNSVIERILKLTGVVL